MHPLALRLAAHTLTLKQGELFKVCGRERRGRHWESRAESDSGSLGGHHESRALSHGSDPARGLPPYASWRLVPTVGHWHGPRWATASPGGTRLINLDTGGFGSIRVGQPGLLQTAQFYLSVQPEVRWLVLFLNWTRTGFRQ